MTDRGRAGQLAVARGDWRKETALTLLSATWAGEEARRGRRRDATPDWRMAFLRAPAIGGWQAARRRLDGSGQGNRRPLWPRPAAGLTGGRGSGAGAGGGGEDGVPEPPAGVPADPTGQPRLHHRLRPHHRRRGEQMQRRLLMIRAGNNRVLGRRTWASGKPRWLGLRVGGGGQGALWASELLSDSLAGDAGRECRCGRAGGSGLRVSF